MDIRSDQSSSVITIVAVDIFSRVLITITSVVALSILIEPSSLATVVGIVSRNFIFVSTVTIIVARPGRALLASPVDFMTVQKVHTVFYFGLFGSLLSTVLLIPR
jgi:hypothetical protein